MEIATKTIETTGTIDAQNQLVLDEPLTVVGPTRVRVIILLPEEADIGEEELQNTLLNVDLRQLSRNEEAHLEEEFEEYDKRYPYEFFTYWLKQNMLPACFYSSGDSVMNEQAARSTAPTEKLVWQGFQNRATAYDAPFKEKK